jgi:hypothetical protein
MPPRHSGPVPGLVGPRAAAPGQPEVLVRPCNNEAARRQVSPKPLRLPNDGLLSCRFAY